MTSTSKYEGNAAEQWSDRTYANRARYLSHRADLVCSLGVPLERGDVVLDLACGDGWLGEMLTPRGITYVGVDASGAMVREARRRLGDSVTITEADLNDFRPEENVAATTLFGALYYVKERLTFFRRVAEFTDRKFVFNVTPRRFDVAAICSELQDAGFHQVLFHPFLVPQSVRLPRAMLTLMIAAERSGPVARVLLRVRFTYICAALKDP